MKTLIRVGRVAALALSLFGCGVHATPKALNEAGSLALSSGRYEAAAKDYARALSALGTDTSSPEFQRATLGHVQAELHTDAAAAKTEFLTYARTCPGKLTENDYSLVAGKFGDAGKFDEAGEILEVAKKAFSESPILDVLGKDLAKRAAASGNAGSNAVTIEKLRSLGYIGGAN